MYKLFYSSVHPVLSKQTSCLFYLSCRLIGKLVVEEGIVHPSNFSNELAEAMRLNLFIYFFLGGGGGGGGGGSGKGWERIKKNASVG